MKAYHFLSVFYLFLNSQFVTAQSVGIGTNTPGARLDITKPGGDTPSLNIRGSANISHFNFGAAEHTYIRGGKAASNVLINDYPGSGNIGFGTANPITRFHFYNGPSGNFFPHGLMALEGNSNTYLNILAPNANETGLLFGKATDAVSGGIVYNNPNTTNGLQFRTNGNTNRMVIDANGNVGIGNNNPEFALDIANRIRIRSGGGFSSAGLYFNKNDNSSVAGFIGMQDDEHLGFWGSGVGWKFTMNTQTGALSINGTDGTPGQVVTSNGNSQVEWKSPTKQVYDNTIMKLLSTDLSMAQSTPRTELPNLTHTFTISQKMKVIVTYDLMAGNVGCGFCGETGFAIFIGLNGNMVAEYGELSSNGQWAHITGNTLLDLNPGTHTINILVDNGGPANVNFLFVAGGYRNRMILHMIPE